jgi:hypothetical protein
MAAMKAYGYPMFIVRTYDTEEKQLKIYAQGRTLPGKIVTWTRRGWHNLTKNGEPCARAVDLAFRTQERFPERKEWSLKWPWERLKKIAAGCDLSRPLARDKGHLVDKQGQSFKQAWNKRS